MARMCTIALIRSLPHIVIGEFQCTPDAGRLLSGSQVTRGIPDIDRCSFQCSVIVDDGLVDQVIEYDR